MDHIGFLIECLQKLHEDGGLTVSWNSFVEVKKKDPLPPISTPSKVDDMRDGELLSLLLASSVKY